MVTTTILMYLAAFIEAGSGAVIGFGVLGAAVRAVKLCYSLRMKLEEALPEIRLLLGRWLALSLELMLAADILRTLIAPTWDEIGRLGAIVVLRTTLNYFLEREIEQALVRKTDNVPVPAF